MYFTSPTSTISSVASMSSSTASSLAMDIRPRSSSSISSTSNSGYSAWPYRSCTINAASSEEPNSYLSDEDLFFSAEEDFIASPAVELSTEEHIAMLRKVADQQESTRPSFWNQPQPFQQRRYSKPQSEEQKKKARTGMGKRKKSTTKKVIFATPSDGQG